MDYADIGGELYDRENEQLVELARAQAKVKRFPHTGQCYNCEAELKDRVFCDSLCRDEYEEYRAKMKRRIHA